MPLVGLVDPSHSERRKNKPGRLPAWFTLDELRRKTLTEGPTWSPWTTELITAALAEHQERGDRLSTTLVVSACPRGAILERMEDYIGDLDQFYPALRGTMVHRTMEYVAREQAVAEARFFTTMYVEGYGDVEVSCSPDLVTGGVSPTVWDYKVTETPPSFDYPYRHHTEQLQLNRFIVNNAEKWELGSPPDGEYPEGWQRVNDWDREMLPWNPRTLQVQHLVVVYLGPKWSKPMDIRRKETRITPNGDKVPIKVPDIWTDDRIHKEFDERLAWIVRGLAWYPDFPEGAEEVWHGDRTWRCPGPPVCRLPNCIAKRWPNGLLWDRSN
jgi:hypothetical protein